MIFYPIGCQERKLSYLEWEIQVPPCSPYSVVTDPSLSPSPAPLFHKPRHGVKWTMRSLAKFGDYGSFICRPLIRTGTQCSEASSLQTIQLYLLLAALPWASFFTSLCLGFSSIKCHHFWVPHCVMENFNWDNICQVLRTVPGLCNHLGFYNFLCSF